MYGDLFREFLCGYLASRDEVSFILDHFSCVPGFTQMDWLSIPARCVSTATPQFKCCGVDLIVFSSIKSIFYWIYRVNIFKTRTKHVEQLRWTRQGKLAYSVNKAVPLSYEIPRPVEWCFARFLRRLDDPQKIDPNNSPQGRWRLTEKKKW